MNETESSLELQLVIFQLATEEYGLPITKVQEINRLVPITKLPQAPAFMEGIINLREQIIPIVDLRKRFKLPPGDHDDNNRIIVVEVNGQVVGITVDAVHEVVRLQQSCIEPPPAAFILDSEYIHGVGKFGDRLIILLDIDKILTSQEEITLKELNRDAV